MPFRTLAQLHGDEPHFRGDSWPGEEALQRSKERRRTLGLKTPRARGEGKRALYIYRDPLGFFLYTLRSIILCRIWSLVSLPCISRLVVCRTECCLGLPFQCPPHRLLVNRMYAAFSNLLSPRNSNGPPGQAPPTERAQSDAPDAPLPQTVVGSACTPLSNQGATTETTEVIHSAHSPINRIQLPEADSQKIQEAFEHLQDSAAQSVVSPDVL